MNLKGELHNIHKGFENVDVYLQKIKVVRDKLMVAGVILTFAYCNQRPPKGIQCL